MKQVQDAYIVAATRTPIGRSHKGFFRNYRPDDLLATTLKRLSMFVLRTKVKLTDASDEFALYGLAGDALISIACSACPAWSKADFDDQILVHLYPALGQPRGLWIAPQGSPAPQGQALDAALWAWGEVRSGVATLSAPLVETFVPQMLNYESVGGVNFKKGCDPGQEVVARSQFRGQLKRRTYLAHSPSALAVGAEIFTAEDAEQAVGLVVQSAPAPAGGWDALVCLQTHASSADLRAGPAPLALQPLPYALLTDV